MLFSIKQHATRSWYSDMALVGVYFVFTIESERAAMRRGCRNGWLSSTSTIIFNNHVHRGHLAPRLRVGQLFGVHIAMVVYRRQQTRKPAGSSSTRSGVQRRSPQVDRSSHQLSYTVYYVSTLRLRVEPSESGCDSGLLSFIPRIGTVVARRGNALERVGGCATAATIARE